MEAVRNPRRLHSNIETPTSRIDEVIVLIRELCTQLDDGRPAAPRRGTLTVRLTGPVLSQHRRTGRKVVGRADDRAGREHRHLPEQGPDPVPPCGSTNVGSQVCLGYGTS